MLLKSCENVLFYIHLQKKKKRKEKEKKKSQLPLAEDTVLEPLG